MKGDKGYYIMPNCTSLGFQELSIRKSSLETHREATCSSKR